jgi:hypothetical protein
MTDEQIIQLAEHFGVHMRTRPSGFVDNGDGSMSFRKVELHYAGQNVIDLIRAITAEQTKKQFNSKPTLHKIIREYEKYGMTASEMIGRIMLLEGVSDKDL